MLHGQKYDMLRYEHRNRETAKILFFPHLFLSVYVVLVSETCLTWDMDMPHVLKCPFLGYEEDKAFP